MRWVLVAVLIGATAGCGGGSAHDASPTTVATSVAPVTAAPTTTTLLSDGERVWCGAHPTETAAAARSLGLAAVATVRRDGFADWTAYATAVRAANSRPEVWPVLTLPSSDQDLGLNLLYHRTAEVAWWSTADLPRACHAAYAAR